MPTITLDRLDVEFLLEALDSHCYEHAPDGAVRNSGYILDPRLDRDEDENPLDDEEQEIADWLDDHDRMEKILRTAIRCPTCHDAKEIERDGVEKQGRRIVRRFKYTEPCPTCCPQADPLVGLEDRS